MTPQRQREVIAEIDGWKRHANKPLWEKEGCLHDGWAQHFLEELPDYLNDRNAMAQARSIFTDRQKEVYAHVLMQISGEWRIHDWKLDVPQAEDYIGYIELPPAATYLMLNASAEQQAEAFLRTMGKWEESA